MLACLQDRATLRGMRQLLFALGLLLAPAAHRGEARAVAPLLGHWRLDPARSDPIDQVAQRLGVPWWKRALAPSRVEQELTLDGSTLQIRTQGHVTRSERLPLDGQTVVTIDIAGRSAMVRAQLEGEVLVLRGALSRGNISERLESRRWVHKGDTYVVTIFGEGSDVLRFTRVFVRMPEPRGP